MESDKRRRAEAKRRQNEILRKKEEDKRNLKFEDEVPFLNRYQYQPNSLVYDGRDKLVQCLGLYKMQFTLKL